MEKYPRHPAAGQFPPPKRVCPPARPWLRQPPARLRRRADPRPPAVRTSRENYGKVLDGVIAAMPQGAEPVAALKASLDSYNAFYQGLLSYTEGVAEAAAGSLGCFAGPIISYPPPLFHRFSLQNSREPYMSVRFPARSQCYPIIPPAQWPPCGR